MTENCQISAKFVKECEEELSPIMVVIFNQTITDLIYPHVLKVHKIVLILKQANSAIVDKFRPIPVLSVIDKIFEKLLCDRLLLYLEENDLLYYHQFAIRKVIRYRR